MNSLSINPTSQCYDFLWIQIALHLKPRYLAKLMQTCKYLNELLGAQNKDYWTRVAAHTVWRYHDAVEVMTIRSPADVLPPIAQDQNLFYMLALDHGYFWGMELFFKRMDETIQHYSVNDTTQDYCDWWAALKAMTLEGKTRWMMKEIGMQVDANTSMKDFVKQHTLKTLSSIDKPFNKFLCDIEDDPMPPVFKRRLMRRLEDCLWSSCETDPSDLACRICKF
jgi:hypothetical protein